MSKIAIFSDSHHRDDLLQNAIKSALEQEIDYIIHLGDIKGISTLDLIEGCGIPYQMVFGNNDYPFMPLAGSYSIDLEPILLDFFDITINIMHLPMHIDSRADINLYGHLHLYKLESTEGKIVLNPGEICGRESGRVEYVILEIESEKILVKRYFKAINSEEDFEKEIEEVKRS